jgi:hypothetical protein
MLAVTWTQFIIKGRTQPRVKERARVVEPELDMTRAAPHPSSVIRALVKLVNWLAPMSRATRAPMRSVARELEEAFPISER